MRCGSQGSIAARQRPRKVSQLPRPLQLPASSFAPDDPLQVKFLSVDSSVAILGNGNQDSQSWFHSQECNLMIDSPSLVAGWEAQLRGNQNTGEFGRVGSDGVWRDGKTGEGLREVKKKGAVRAVLGLVGLV